MEINFSILFSILNCTTKTTINMTYKYKIYQLDPHNPEQLKKMYRDYDYVVKSFGEININDYRTVYEGELKYAAFIDDEGACDALFEKFNLYHPEDFRGHSLSVGDIVDINGKKYYCDSIGWKEL
jgi:hypothetical protein